MSSATIPSIQFPECDPYPGSQNSHGERETLLGVEFTHYFVRALRSRYHLVAAGDPSKPVTIFLHGLPESWYAFHQQMAALAESHFCIGIDLKGYGQSEKTLNSDYSFAHCAFELGVLIDRLGIDNFSIVSHDRGTVVADHLCNLPNQFGQRIDRYVRMQQSANKPHAEPRPPHRLFASDVGTLLFGSPEFIPMAYDTRPATPPPIGLMLTVFGGLQRIGVPARIRQAIFNFALRRARASASGAGQQYVHQPIPARIVERMQSEFSFPGVSEAVPLTFRQTNFDIEYEDRMSDLFDAMTMPVLFLQGALDPGQPKSDFEGLEEFRSNFRLQFVEDGGHFVHLECPDPVTDAIRAFLVDEVGDEILHDKGRADEPAATV